MVCKTTVHFANNDDQPCNSDLIKLSDPNNYSPSPSATPSISLHFRKILYLSHGSFHGFIVDNGSIDLSHVTYYRRSDYSQSTKGLLERSVSPWFIC